MFKISKLIMLVISPLAYFDIYSAGSKKKSSKHNYSIKYRYTYENPLPKRYVKSLKKKLKKLIKAIRMNEVKQACLIIEKLDNLNVGESCKNPLALAVFHNRVSIAEKLISKGANVNFASPARFVQSVEMLDLLLNNGLNIYPSNENNLPLCFSVLKRKRLSWEIKGAMIGRLVEHGFDLNEFYEVGPYSFPETALTFAEKENASIIFT